VLPVLVVMMPPMVLLVLPVLLVLLVEMLLTAHLDRTEPMDMTVWPASPV